MTRDHVSLIIALLMAACVFLLDFLLLRGQLLSTAPYAVPILIAVYPAPAHHLSR